MSRPALIMMLFTWIVVAFFTIHFFVKVLLSPQDKTTARKNDDQVE